MGFLGVGVGFFGYLFIFKGNTNFCFGPFELRMSVKKFKQKC